MKKDLEIWLDKFPSITIKIEDFEGVETTMHPGTDYSLRESMKMSVDDILDDAEEYFSKKHNEEITF